MTLLSDLTTAADHSLESLLDPHGEPARARRARGHRGVMTVVKSAVVVALAHGHASPDAEALAEAWLADLIAMQTPDGLFTWGDNLDSPPDSAFTINDVAVVVALLRAYPDVWPAGGDGSLVARLETILRRALPALVSGGIHTPNHRWEISSAMAHAGALLGGPSWDAARARAQEWLSEGVDVDADGIYGERSANYAAHVSDPSLLTLAAVLERADLIEIVHRSLHATLDLSSPAGEVETVHSRRQDQKSLGFPLGPFLGHLAHFASSCERCRRAVRRAAASQDVDAVGVLAQALLSAEVRAGIDAADGIEESGAAGSGPDPQGASERWFAGVRLLRRQAGPDWATVYGGSDVPAHGRIVSGLACNPTFLRFSMGGVGIRSVRLSRDFFAMGPFRAQHTDRDETIPGRIEMHEEISSGYYQPLPLESRRADGEYPVEFEGRFAAAMAFSARAKDVLTLRTDIAIELTGHERLDAVTMAISTDGPSVVHALEIALADGVEIAGATDLGHGRWLLADDEVVVRQGPTTVRIEPDAGSAPGLPAGYDPGESYAFLGGTDAVGGTRLYLTWRSPATRRIRLSRD